MLGKIEGKEKGTREDKTVAWHHQLNGYESEQALGDSEGQGSLACFSLLLLLLLLSRFSCV